MPRLQSIERIRTENGFYSFPARGCPDGLKLSGLTKQEYIIRRLTDREITVVGNPRVYKALRDQMKLIYQELQRLAVDEEVPPDLLETLQMVSLTLNGLKEECE